MLARRFFLVGIITLLSVNLAIAQDPPATHPKTTEPLVLEVFRGTPDIDGDLSDWNLRAMTPAVLDVEEQIHTGAENWDNAEDCSGEFYLLWDDEYIYMAVVVKDDSLSMTKTGGDIWNADAIEVFFSTTNAVPPHDEHYQYGFNANNQKWNWCNMDGDGSREPEYLQVASSLTPEGYICEAAIEYGKMLSLEFVSGNTIGFHPVIDDTEATDREIQITWTGREAHDQSLGYGHITFSDSTVGPPNPRARRPEPRDGDMLVSIWTMLGWKPGPFAVSHDVYVGDNFDDVNNGTEDTFTGNHVTDTLIVGFPGYPVPGGLVPGTTYYWRVDEVNDANAASPWKGDIWSFSIQPYTAYNPSPADGAEFVDLETSLSWDGGYGAKLHYLFIGESFEDVNSAAAGLPVGLTTHKPSLEPEKVLFWRIDEFDGLNTYKGDVWAFTTPGAVGNPSPAGGEADVQKVATLGWTAADNATSHELYFGADVEAVRNATKASPEYIGPRSLDSESYDPAGLAWGSSYAWRVDEVYPTGTVKGPVWTFTSADFLSVDDFEAYNDIDPPDPASNTIYSSWADGYQVPTNGALTAEEFPPYAEQNIVRSGSQAMKYVYDASGKICESTKTLVWPRDWTDEGVTKLSLWHRGSSSNAADRMFIALNGTAVVYHDDPAATQITGWRNWVIDLTDFGINLANVNTITIGIGTKNVPSPGGGAGTVYFDDIRLIR